jgi:hypothetical protein
MIGIRVLCIGLLVLRVMWIGEYLPSPPNPSRSNLTWNEIVKIKQILLCVLQRRGIGFGYRSTSKLCERGREAKV